jgi:ligand-binding sensor domain-containing protein
VATSFRLEQKEAHTRPRRVLATAFLAASLALAASRASGLNRATALSQYGRDLWDSDSGLPQNSVDAILQTRDGYLWLGTQEGLIRFDGVRFRIFDSRNTPAMRDDWVLSFCETRDGTLWVGTAEGLLRGRDGRFDGWQPDGPPAAGMIRSLVQARDGALWAASNDGVIRLEGHSSRLFTEKDGLPGK